MRKLCRLPRFYSKTYDIYDLELPCSANCNGLSNEGNSYYCTKELGSNLCRNRRTVGRNCWSPNYLQACSNRSRCFCEDCWIRFCLNAHGRDCCDKKYCCKCGKTISYPCRKTTSSIYYNNFCGDNKKTFPCHKSLPIQFTDTTRKSESLCFLKTAGCPKTKTIKFSEDLGCAPDNTCVEISTTCLQQQPCDSYSGITTYSFKQHDCCKGRKRCKKRVFTPCTLDPICIEPEICFPEKVEEVHSEASCKISCVDSLKCIRNDKKSLIKVDSCEGYPKLCNKCCSNNTTCKLPSCMSLCETMPSECGDSCDCDCNTRNVAILILLMMSLIGYYFCVTLPDSASYWPIQAYDSASSDLCCDLQEGTSTNCKEYCQTWEKRGNVCNYRFQKKNKICSQFYKSGSDEEYNSGCCYSNCCRRGYGHTRMHRALNVPRHCSNKGGHTTISSSSTDTDENFNCYHCCHKQSNIYRTARCRKLEKHVDCHPHFCGTYWMKALDTNQEKEFSDYKNHCIKCGRKICYNSNKAVHDVYYGENMHNSVYNTPIDLDTNSIVLQLPCISNASKNDENIPKDNIHFKSSIKTSQESGIKGLSAVKTSDSSVSPITKKIHKCVLKPHCADKKLMCSIEAHLPKCQTASTQTNKSEEVDTSKDKTQKLKAYKVSCKPHNYRNVEAAVVKENASDIKEISFIDLPQQNQTNKSFTPSGYQPLSYDLNKDYSPRESNCTLTLYPPPILDISSFFKVRRLLSKTSKPLSYAFFDPITFDKSMLLREEEKAPKYVTNLTEKPVYTIPPSCKAKNCGTETKQPRTGKPFPNIRNGTNNRNGSKEDDDAIPVFIAISGSSFAIQKAERLKRRRCNCKCRRRRMMQALQQNRDSLPTIYESVPSSEDECSSSLISLQSVKVNCPFLPSEKRKSFSGQDPKPPNWFSNQEKCKQSERGSISTATTIFNTHTFSTGEDKVCDYYLQPSELSWGNWEKLMKKFNPLTNLNNRDVQSLLYVSS